MTETIDGNCHCRAVTFTVRFDGPIETTKCNCSICRPTRFWMTVVPSEAFALNSGAETLTTYAFRPRRIIHHFCSTCGVKLYGVVNEADGSRVAVSVPTLDLTAERLASLPVDFHDGAHDVMDHPPAITSYL